MSIITNSYLNKSESDEKTDAGFTIVEVIAVITIVSILTVIAIIRFSAVNDAALRAAANLIISEIAYAQETARLHHKGTVVDIFSSEGEGEDSNTYTLRYQDGTWIKNPKGGENYIVELGAGVLITSSDITLEFDSSGKLDTPDTDWDANQTSMIVCTFNESVNIRIARFTGKTWMD